MIRLQPLHTESLEELPLGFSASDDLASGDVYVDDSGALLSVADFNTRLRDMRGKIRIVRVGVRFWMPGDPKDGPPKLRVVNVPVSGALESADIGRAVHEAVRRLYDNLKRKEK